MSAMQVIQSPEKLTAIISALKKKGKRIGFVPTMGFLHDGHLSLVRQSVKENDVTVVSIFVNPVQFGPKEDFKRYPRNLRRDLKLLSQVSADFVFAPSVKAIYPENFNQWIEPGPLAKPLCGAKRPGHFRGVATVVKRLFDIVLPDVAYFGQKDFQQCRVIEDMVKRLFLRVRIVICPTVRERDGLAMSSRNIYLTPLDRILAKEIPVSLALAKEMIRRGIRQPEKVRRSVICYLKPFVDRIDYVEVLSGATLKRTTQLKGRVVVAVACFIGKARLIDNLVIRI